MRYSVLLWDVDGTLLDFLAAEKAAIRACFHHFNLGEITDEQIRQYSEINKRYWERLERGEITKHEVLVGRFRELFERLGRDTSVVEAFNDRYQISLGDTIVYCDNSLQLLQSLQGQVRQYAVSNGTVIAQTKKLGQSGLGACMNGVFLSEEIGCEKPSKAFFDAVFEQIDAQPRECLIIGDSLTSDIQGGINAGIATCWYNPHHQVNAKGIRPNYEIRSLWEVPKLIRTQGEN